MNYRSACYYCVLEKVLLSAVVVKPQLFDNDNFILNPSFSYKRFLVKCLA